MPDRPESTAPPDPPAAVSPPTIDPARWEDHPTFRESLLRHCTGPEANAAMRAFGMLLFEMVLEWNNTQPDEPEGYIRHDARAALAELRAVQGFLAYVGSEREDLDEDDPEKADLIRLCKLVGKQAGKVAKIAARIEGALS
jgi:hypothetical protein